MNAPLPVPVRCVTCAHWCPVALPFEIPGAPVVGLCKPASLRHSRGVYVLPDGSSVPMHEARVTRPHDLCGQYEAAPQPPRWWQVDLVEPEPAPLPAGGKPKAVQP